MGVRWWCWVVAWSVAVVAAEPVDDQLAAADNLAAAGKYAAAARLYRQLARAHPRHPRAVEAAYGALKWNDPYTRSFDRDVRAFIRAHRGTIWEARARVLQAHGMDLSDYEWRSARYAEAMACYAKVLGRTPPPVLEREYVEQLLAAATWEGDAAGNYGHAGTGLPAEQESNSHRRAHDYCARLEARAPGRELVAAAHLLLAAVDAGFTSYGGEPTPQAEALFTRVYHDFGDTAAGSEALATVFELAWHFREDLVKAVPLGQEWLRRYPGDGRDAKQVREKLDEILKPSLGFGERWNALAEQPGRFKVMSRNLSTLRLQLRRAPSVAAGEAWCERAWAGPPPPDWPVVAEPEFKLADRGDHRDLNSELALPALPAGVYAAWSTAAPGGAGALLVVGPAER